MPHGINAREAFTIRGAFSMDVSNKRGISNGSERVSEQARGDRAVRCNDRGLLKNVIATAVG